MQVDNAQSVIISAGSYDIATFSYVYDVNNTVIAQRGVRGSAGLATWGMSGCHGVAVFGGHTNQTQVDWVAMFHASGGLTSDRLDEFLAHVARQIPQPGGNFEWVVVLSQGDESAQTSSWTGTGAHAANCTLFNVQATHVHIINGPAPGGSHDAFAVDFAGHWGALGGNIVSAPPWSVAPRHAGVVRIGNPPKKSGCCCFITTACCQHLGLADDCVELETLRAYRDEVLATTEQGRRDIDQYYRQAPAIVTRLDARADCAQVYGAIYRDYLLPAVRSIQAGQHEQAYRVYKTLVADLTGYLDGTERAD